MAIEYNFILDMDRSKRDNNIAYARTGDVDSVVINASLVLNGSPYTPTGTNAFFECITPNGHSIRAAAEKTGSTVSVEVPSAAFQAAGVINVAYFRFESGEADNPTYVESTEPFAIVVREGIGDNIDAGDYIEEWRALADHLDAVVAEVEQKAEQAEAAINEQKTEVDKLKAQVQVSMAQDAEDVSDAKDTAISNINGSQGAVDAAIDQLEEKTQEAVDAAQAAIDGTLAAGIEAEVGRTLKLDVADMVEISSNANLSSLTTVGSYCCKTAAVAATISDSPVDDSPFNMYVFSSSTAGQVMQLVVPIDLNSKPTAVWHVRFGTSSAMDTWSVIGGMPDIVPVSQGGTGVTTAEAERDRLGLGNTTGAVPIANGGTGATSAAQARQNIGAGTSDFSGSYDDLTEKPTIPSIPVPITQGGTGATTAAQARQNLDAAKASVTSTYSTLSGSNEVTGSLSDSVHTKFTLDQLLTWLKDQGIGGSQDGMVAGVIYPYTGSAIPNGFLLCNGAAVSRMTYSKLFEAIGTTYGAGDGSSTFNLPNLKQRMLIGSGDGMANGTTGGSNTHQHEYGVTFGEYFSGIVKPLRTYDYGTSAASNNVEQLGVTPAGTTVNGGMQDSSRNPISLPFEYVAYGNTKEASSLPQYLVVNYIISTGEVDATARSYGFSIEYPITIENGGTGATDAANARTNIAAAYGISSVQGSLSDSTKVTSNLSSSTNTNFTLSSLWSNWLEDKISTYLGTYGTFKKIYQNTDQSMTAQSSAVLQGFQNGKILILICRLYVPSYTTTTDYESSTQAWTGLTFPSQIPTAMTPTSVLSDWTTLTPMYQCGMVSSGGSSNWNDRLVLQQVKLASNGRGLTGNVNTFDTVATNKTPNQVWVNAYMFLVA